MLSSSGRRCGDQEMLTWVLEMLVLEVQRRGGDCFPDLCVCCSSVTGAAGG